MFSSFHFPAFCFPLSAFACLITCVPVAAQESTLFDSPPLVSTVAPPLDSQEHMSTPGDTPPKLPIADTPFFEHVRRELTEKERSSITTKPTQHQVNGFDATTSLISQGDILWTSKPNGLYFSTDKKKQFDRHPTYGIEGPPSNVITGLAVDSQQTLWVATPAGLASRTGEGTWEIIRGRQGLPAENLTCLAIDSQDRLWIGSTQGLIQYRPYAEGRQWYFRANKRYLSDNNVVAVQISDDNHSVFAKTSSGWTCIEEVERTLHSKAEYLQARYLERHRRNGMPAPALYESLDDLDHWTHEPQASDGLWTSYHIAAMCYAYTLTGEERYRKSAQEGMEALYTLQNITGIEGLVARSFATVDEPAAAKLKKQNNWIPTDDGKYIWRDDVSSDQITGHYFAFHVYYDHIARHDPAESARLKKQIRQVTDYILDHNYQIIDHDGKRTLWGWWNPELLNEVPGNFLESGIYSLMMLSFLRTTNYITGDEKYLDHYRKLIEEHNYLSNLLLQKKVFPDEHNHSDDQLSALVFYSYMLVEDDPFIRDAVHRALRRHARIERNERNSLFAFVYAASDPEDADILGGIQTLREIPQDFRRWASDNSQRADVTINTKETDNGAIQLTDALPADERTFERWNANPYKTQDWGNGLSEGTGVHYLLPYWMGRYHRLIAPPSN